MTAEKPGPDQCHTSSRTTSSMLTLRSWGSNVSSRKVKGNSRSRIQPVIDVSLPWGVLGWKTIRPLRQDAIRQRLS